MTTASNRFRTLRRPIRGLSALGLTVSLCASMAAQDVTLDAVGRGTVYASGLHASTYTNGGLVNGYAVGRGQNSLPSERERSFFVFDLPMAPVGRHAVSASLRLFVPGQPAAINGGPSEVFVHDVDGPVSALESATAAFQDLGDDAPFASRIYSDSDEGNFTELTLNAAGLAALDAAAGGKFALSIRNSDEDRNDQNYIVFGGSGTLNNTQDGNSQLLIDWSDPPATAYEQFLVGANDLSGQAFTFTPNGTDGYDITAAGAFDNGFSNAVAFGDDDLQGGFPLGFPIHVPGAGTVSRMQISSNGWVAPDHLFVDSDFSESTAEMEGQGARIAMLWDDLSPNAGGAVYVDGSPTRWMVTFDQVPQFNTGDSNTFQVQIRPDGSFTLAYGTVAADCIAGVSFGNDRPAQQIDLTADLPFATAGGYSSHYAFGEGCPNGIHTFFEDVDAGTIDLAGFAYTLTPNAIGGYDVTPTGSFVSGFTNNLALGDDQLVDALPLGFTITVPGAGMVSALDVSSNGWVAPDNANTSSQAFESDTLFTGSFPRWAVLWDDLNPTAGGGVYFDTMPGLAMVTYDQVPQFSGGAGPTTAQIQFRADGSVTIVYDATVVDANLDGIFGFSAGNGAEFRIVDLTADLPLTTTDATPATYSLSATPALGTTVDFQLNDLPANASVASVFIGVNQLENDLTGIGMPTCFQYTETALWIDCPAPMSGSSTLTLALPNDPALLGARFVTQGAAVALGINALGVVSSNALQVNLGR